MMKKKGKSKGQLPKINWFAIGALSVLALCAYGIWDVYQSRVDLDRRVDRWMQTK